VIRSPSIFTVVLDTLSYWHVGTTVETVVSTPPTSSSTACGAAFQVLLIHFIPRWPSLSTQRERITFRSSSCLLPLRFHPRVCRSRWPHRISLFTKCHCDWTTHHHSVMRRRLHRIYNHTRTFFPPKYGLRHELLLFSWKGTFLPCQQGGP
jgi:hypothetical protein